MKESMVGWRDRSKEKTDRKDKLKRPLSRKSWRDMQDITENKITKDIQAWTSTGLTSRVLTSKSRCNGQRVQLEGRRAHGLEDGLVLHKEGVQGQSMAGHTPGSTTTHNRESAAHCLLNAAEDEREEVWKGDMHNEKVRDHTWRQGVKQVEFGLELYKHQVNNGCRFLHEHPLGATPWAIAPMQALLQDHRVMQIKADMCRFNMAQENDGGKRTLAEKPTRCETNSWAIADELDNVAREDTIIAGNLRVGQKLRRSTRTSCARRSAAVSRRT